MQTNRKTSTSGDEPVLGPDSYPTLHKKAVDTLASSLTEEEIVRLLSIKREINGCIHWGKVVNESLGPILHSMESVIFGGSTELLKVSPQKSLFPNELALLEESDKAHLNRHYITLVLTKKLLGALKTRINRMVEDIPILSNEEVEGIQDLLEPVEERRYMEPQLADQSGLSEEGSICPHTRTTSSRNRRQVWDGDRGLCEALQTHCKDCHTVVRTVLISKTKASGKKKDEPCRHRYVEWVEGQEGRVAQCSDKHGCEHQVDDPEILKAFQWGNAGLEPYGDDPSQDEVIVL